MALILDTSILIEIERKNNKIINEISQIRKLNPGLMQITLISYSEFLLGIKERKQSNIDKAMKFITTFPVLNANKETAIILANLKYNYEKKGMILSLADLLIAAQTIENNMLLVTMDKGLERIKELKKIIL
ncbi:type II toxin-antitoxin system VapC family toxin [Candidatus Woesearchaeota archaeon]|nr:type II toxin-antitoxin system VapC family toxin [Candidatus Woesearchaeota archaeon]